MRSGASLRIRLGVTVLLGLSQVTWANQIAKFADPLPNGGGAWMFLYRQGTHGLYAGWAGPPYLYIETPLGSFAGCTMQGWPMYLYPDGRVVGGNMTFYGPGQVPLLQVIFYNAFADTAGLRCGPQTGGTVEFTYFEGGVQLPPGLSEPLQGGWINFEFHNQHQGPMGPEWTASFTCGARGKKGDLNGDGLVDFDDIAAFALALSDPASFAATYPWGARENGDINNDGQVNFADIDGFVALLGG